MRPRFPLSFCLALLVLAGCSRDSRQETGAVTFRVDPARLGERFERPGLGLRLRAPAGWSGLPDSTLARIRARMGQMAALASSHPEVLAVYRGSADGALLIVSRYATEWRPESRDSLALVRLRQLKIDHASGKVEDGRFTYHGYEIVQLRTVDSTTVAFELLVSGPARPLMQLDYVVPRMAYPRELEAVESSIGSLEPIS